MPMEPWKILASRDVLRGQWIRLRADRCEIAPGKIIEDYYVLEEWEWVHVVALDANQRVLLVRQYRHAISEFSWELPGGAAEEDEDLLQTAQRELLEETGAVGNNWQHLGGYATNPGRHDNRVQGYVAENVRVAQAQTLDDNEAIECAFYPIEDVLRLIESGEFSNAMHVALFYRALHVLGLLRISAVSPRDKPLA
jgi:8-oxo-dGTP pyrophosphatase MutT (NUDIX family)